MTDAPSVPITPFLKNSVWFKNYLDLATIGHTLTRINSTAKFGDPYTGYCVERYTIQPHGTSQILIVEFRRSLWKTGVSHRRVSDTFSATYCLPNGDRRAVRYAHINHVAKCISRGKPISSHYLV